MKKKELKKGTFVWVFVHGPLEEAPEATVHGHYRLARVLTVDGDRIEVAVMSDFIRRNSDVGWFTWSPATGHYDCYLYYRGVPTLFSVVSKFLGSAYGPENVMISWDSQEYKRYIDGIIESAKDILADLDKGRKE